MKLKNCVLWSPHQFLLFRDIKHNILFTKDLRIDLTKKEYNNRGTRFDSYLFVCYNINVGNMGVSMKIDHPIEISKQPSEYLVTLRDISTSGVSFYTNRMFYPGMKLDIRIDDGPAIDGSEVIRLQNNDDDDFSESDFILALQFDKDMSDKSGREAVAQWIEQFPLVTSYKEGHSKKERRKYPRREISFLARVKETSPKINSKNFALSQKGLHCVIDQYIPIFHEIEVNLGKGSQQAQNSFSGVVIRCEKNVSHEYDLDIFFPETERIRLNEIFHEK